MVSQHQIPDTWRLMKHRDSAKAAEAPRQTFCDSSKRLYVLGIECEAKGRDFERSQRSECDTKGERRSGQLGASPSPQKEALERRALLRS